ncbi:hypothetical protein [Streptomyces graminofaciens]|nr:hypothetical protein [Streptomyces graminofaciens]
MRTALGVALHVDHDGARPLLAARARTAVRENPGAFRPAAADAVATGP